MTVCTLSSELIEKATERASSAWLGSRATERVRERERERARGAGLAVLGVSGAGTAVRGVVGKTAVAGTSWPSLRRRRSSLVRRWVASVGGSDVEDPDADEGATERTEPLRVG